MQILVKSGKGVHKENSTTSTLLVWNNYTDFPKLEDVSPILDHSFTFKIKKSGYGLIFDIDGYYWIIIRTTEAMFKFQPLS